MADTIFDIIILPTYSSLTLGILDNSTYVVEEPILTPVINITPPGFDAIDIAFTVSDYNIFESDTLGITAVGDDKLPLPDGVYEMIYSVAPEFGTAITKTIMRVEQLQEKFDGAFMKLDMMECDRAIKTQAKVDLSTVYFMIQASIAAANNCAVYEANKLYLTANKMLNTFIVNNCGCSGSNYVVNFS